MSLTSKIKKEWMTDKAIRFGKHAAEELKQYNQSAHEIPFPENFVWAEQFKSWLTTQPKDLYKEVETCSRKFYEVQNGLIQFKSFPIFNWIRVQWHQMLRSLHRAPRQPENIDDLESWQQSIEEATVDIQIKQLNEENPHIKEMVITMKQPAYHEDDFEKKNLKGIKSADYNNYYQERVIGNHTFLLKKLLEEVDARDYFNKIEEDRKIKREEDLWRRSKRWKFIQEHYGDMEYGKPV